MSNARDDTASRVSVSGETVSEHMAELSYEYLQRVARRLPVNATTGDHGMWVDPVVYRGETIDGWKIVSRMTDAEQYPGEAFASVVTPEPDDVIPAFVADVGIEPTDVVGLAAPSTQLCDDLFFSVYRALTEIGAVLTTKYPASCVRDRLDGVDADVLDCTPGAENDRDTADGATKRETPVRCGDLTSMGVVTQEATARLAERDATSRFGINTVTQLLSHHSADALDRFFHELIGQWRNHGVGGLVHVPPADAIDGDRCFGSAHFDYVVGIRTENGTVEGCVRGKRDVEPVWRSIGVSPSSGVSPFGGQTVPEIGRGQRHGAKPE